MKKNATDSLITFYWQDIISESVAMDLIFHAKPQRSAKIRKAILAAYVFVFASLREIFRSESSQKNHLFRVLGNNNVYNLLY